MRIPLERKGLPSPSMTPKPGLLSLTAEEQVNSDTGNAQVKPPTTSTILNTATMTESSKDVSLSVSRHRSSHRGRSERRTAEAFLSQDISVVMRRRVLQGYGLESASILTNLPFSCSILYRPDTIQRSSRRSRYQDLNPELVCHSRTFGCGFTVSSCGMSFVLSFIGGSFRGQQSVERRLPKGFPATPCPWL